MKESLSMCLHGWWVEVWVSPAESQPETRRSEPKGSGAGRTRAPRTLFKHACAPGCGLGSTHGRHRSLW
eukprot:1004719-Prymnesium_polylepis.1